METITIKKGLDLPLDGVAERQIIDARSIDHYAVKPTDLVGFVPRLCVAEGDTVQAGQALVVDKNDTRIYLPSPVDGVVEAIVRGEKRRLLEVVVKAAGAGKHAPAEGRVLSAEAPVWWMIKERPFGTVANPDHKPKAIFVSMRDTNPLAPDMDYVLKGREHEFDCGVKALSTLAEVRVVRAEGPHPAGNIGTIVAKLAPINKGECIWMVNAQDVANIGRWMLTGEYRPERIVSVGGPAAKAPKHYRLTVGACVKQITDVQLMNKAYPMLADAEQGGTRVISGSVLSGTRIAADGYLGMYDQQLTLIAEGDEYEFMGWLMPGLGKFSFSRTFLSGMWHDFVPKCLRSAVNLPSEQFNTNMHGSVRPFLFTGQFERVFPFDIYPLQLIKACIVGDVELQEKLGIYEVEPEDFALCEYIDPSKTDIQVIIREALEVLRKEAMA